MSKEPVKTFLELTRVLSFDFNIFKAWEELGSVLLGLQGTDPRAQTEPQMKISAETTGCRKQQHILTNPNIFAAPQGCCVFVIRGLSSKFHLVVFGFPWCRGPSKCWI